MKMKSKEQIDKTMDDCRTLCNHIKKLSKINNPDLWKKYGEPHISIWTDLTNKKYDSFRTAFPIGIWNETIVFFSVDDVKMSVKQFKEKLRKHTEHLKKLGIYKKTKI